MHSFLQNDFEKLLIIIDHSPSDDLRNICDLKDVQYFHHPENKGYGAGHNIAIRKIMESSPYHLVMNSDIYFGPEVLSEMVDFMRKNKDVALLSPKIVDEQNELQYLSKLLPTPWDLFSKRFLPSFFTKNRMDKFQLKFADYNKIMNVPYLSGSFMLLRTDSLKKVGLFDERFFMYPEDIDLTRRLHRHFKTLYFPMVSVVHHHRASSYKNFGMLFVHIKNMAKYFNKWGWIYDKERREMNKATLKSQDYFKRNE